MFVADGCADVDLISALFFTWFAAACLWTVNALRRPVPPGKRFPPLWLPGMLVSELAPLYFIVRIVVAAVFLALGAAELAIGRAGIWLFAASQVGLLTVIARSIKGAKATGHAPPVFTLLELRESLPKGVVCQPEVPYWDSFTLDIYAREDADTAPALVYVHPGSWMRGRPGRQARALFHRLAARGWMILDIRYPLSPDATFPEHLVGVKRAIAWAKSGEGAAVGADPERVAVAGGSSGAHLAALAALTADDVELQPGFEEVDVSVVACVPFYGIYDLLVRNPTRYDWPFIARLVMKAKPEDDPDLYKRGSPIDQVHSNAPPFLVVHGEFDSVVLPSESQHFVAALREAGVDATYVEVPGAQHGFDAVASLRTRAVANLCTDWLVTKVPSRIGEIGDFR
ncbi:MAG: alpha/beta hydrolase [Actinomycetota bacterium]